ncbi:hypothetical protein MF271_02445 (plasmid) [Deinococcus sp. KNUC1210]|uniref:hypothetical protein n=1 Tax=Deinococcus sp. KNUC1210 TaxID=2917691 RepID=UPI001EF04B06|nr:hypothetical protein [Deinococcus sp. KNUC1210]ULH14158.1 hypothetical protein MF271_02445 [Deinococcus sp. KNUC1210]
MDIDQSKLMDCIRTNALSGSFLNPSGGMLDVNDTTGGGMAWHFSFDDGNAGTNGAALYATNYAVEISNGSCIGVTGACTNSALTQVKGLTVASNQQIYLRGNYNDVNKKPAAVLADAINILSSAVAAGAAGDIKKTLTPATATTVNAAFLSGIDTTVPGWSYNGGLQNYPRLHENWGGAIFTYRGSFVSLGNSVHVQGLQACAYLSDGVTQAACGVGTYYGAPTRNWDYDTSFNDVNNLPPLTPRFVYLRQLLFARTY